ncbi:MAG: heavy-metal-associated domain-containing protein [Candidatus Latescibacterota bacterium]
MSAMKRRTIIVNNMPFSHGEEKIRSELAKMEGICEVQVDQSSGKVDVLYDLLKIDLEEIEQKIAEMGYKIHENFFKRLNDKYIHFTEQNERDNLNASPLPCCSYPDSLHERKK